ncbi:hypothetical protein D7V86_05615 [bacterium D16-51]|nr:hypothetical protein D7V96_07055 [bacterium D16-59]RKI61269.1 hypothetical protein D7V86_05615 [bacterium D16-51]
MSALAAGLKILGAISYDLSIESVLLDGVCLEAGVAFWGKLWREGVYNKKRIAKIPMKWECVCIPIFK